MSGLAKTPGTLLHRALVGDDWSLEAHLLAVAVDRLGVANWQRQGKKGSPRPKPVSPLAKPRDTGQVTGRAEGHTPEEVIARLRRYQTAQSDGE